MNNQTREIKSEYMAFYAEIGWLDALENAIYIGNQASQTEINTRLAVLALKPKNRAIKAIVKPAIGQPKTKVIFEDCQTNKPKVRSMQVSEHDIAKMLVKVIPVDFKPAEFLAMVKTIERKIKRMPENTKLVLKAAYIFSSKVPKQERQDVYQELAMKLLENKPVNEQWAYTIARCDWLDWYRKFKVKSQYSEYDIGSIVSSEIGINEYQLYELEQKSDDMRELVDSERNNQYQKQCYHIAVESLTGLIEYELLDNQITAKSIIEQLPDNIKLIANKRMIGKALLASERQALCRYIKSNPDIVSQARTL